MQRRLKRSVLVPYPGCIVFVEVIACPTSADQLRPKGGKTMVAGAVAEHSNNLQKRRP